jgi:undecaprenyl-diphosphatase
MASLLATTAALLAGAAQSGVAEPSAVEATANGASWLGAALLGLVQGLTEFLPVSSSGHLAIATALLERTSWRVPEGGLAFNVVLHVGTLVAVFAIYGRDIVTLLRDALAGRPRELLLVVLGSVPAGVVGIGLSHWFESIAEDPDVSAACLFLTALFLVVGDAARRRNDARNAALPLERALPRGLTVRDALVVGCAQAIAILPGVSRSGTTIAAGLLCGLDVRAAARFSFLLGSVAIAGAAALEVPQALSEEGASLGRLALGFVLSGVVGVLALRLLLVAIGRGAFRWFAVYCAVVGASWWLFLRS